MNIVEFLEARIAEDEAAARAGGYTHQSGAFANDGYGRLLVNPTRVLAECAAKREVIKVAGSSYPNKVGWYEKKNILEALAAVYSDHPDYREDWPDAI
jgi:Family of unknown function (DUF6221)